MSEKDYYNQSKEAVFNELNTDVNGLTEGEAANRLEEYGLNELKEEEKTTALEIFLNQFKSVLILILILAAAVSGLVLKEYTDMAVILVILVLNSVIGFVQEYRAEQAVEALKRMVSPTCTVVRDGVEEEIEATKVVPGDIVLLSDGDRVPADGRLIEAANLKVDESPLTGESTTVTKDTEALEEDTPLAQRENMTYMGTHVTYGRGKAIITSTGMETEFGNIAGLIQSIPEEESPLKKKTETLGRQLGVAALIGCIVVFGVDYYSGIGIVNSFMTAVSLAVSAIPEGLPAVLIITLSLGARKMARSNAIIRRLNSVETLGTTTVICSDKTGTITKNEMTVREIETPNHSIHVSGEGYTPEGKFEENGEKIRAQDIPELDMILKTGLLCNDARLQRDEDMGSYMIGDPTEGALLVAAVKAEFLPEELDDQYSRVWEVPFDSERKMMSTINDTNGTRYVFAKGAPEVILDKCVTYYDDDQIDELSQDIRERFLDKTQEMGNRALRVLAFAFKEVPQDKQEYTQEWAESGLTFLGIMGMMDPPREAVPDAIRLSRKAGIRPVMITGDHQLTAKAVALEVGIISDSTDEVLTGQQVDSMSNVELLKKVDAVSVYARVSPEHKVRIAQALRSQGNIVAMTGDGVNDAPAIKAADIGIAMGIKGTDVTKEAADMVLADDNFATIVEAVEHGRIIYDNIRKFIRYLVSSNFDEMLVISSFVIAGLPLPFLPVMILWLNLVTDGGPAVALSMDVPTDDLMSIPPRDPDEGILHGMLLFIVAYVVLQSGSTAATFLWKYKLQGASLDISRTVAFMQACMFELVVVWNCRSERHNVFRTGLNNMFLLASTVVGALLTASLCYIPFLQNMFHTVPISIQDWAWVFGSSFLGLLVLPELFYRHK